MADGSKRNKDRAVGGFETVAEELAPVDIPESDSILAVAEPVEEESVVDVSAELPEKETKEVSGLRKGVQQTINSAGKGWTVNVRSEADFVAATEYISKFNPNAVRVVHKPGLGHHSIAVR